MITFRNLGKLGRFGNQLFQYAGTRLYAEKNGYNWAFPDWIGTSIFQNIQSYNTLEHLRARLLPTVQLTDMQSITPLQRVQRVAHLWCQRSMHELYDHPSDNIDLYGYLQDPYSLELLRRQKQQVLSFFQWQPHVERAYREATKKCPPWAGVHIRRGDLVKRNLAISTYIYRQAIQQHASGKPLYLATDDSILKQEFQHQAFTVQDPLPDVYASSPGDLFDFWMLQQATVIIGGGSTFSWWAAYLGNKNAYYSPPLTHLWPPNIIPALERQYI